MKKFLILLIGFVAGVVISTTVWYLIGIKMQNAVPNDETTYFEQPGPEIRADAVKVTEVFTNGFAIAMRCDPIDGYIFSSLKVVLTPLENGLSYYDEQVVLPPAGKRFYQIGTFRINSDGTGQVLPIVAAR